MENVFYESANIINRIFSNEDEEFQNTSSNIALLHPDFQSANDYNSLTFRKKGLVENVLYSNHTKNFLFVEF